MTDQPTTQVPTQVPPQAPPETPPEEPKRIFKQCPCGKVPEKLVLEVDQQSKLGRAMGDCCATWAVEFLRGQTTDPEQILDKAHAAWDAAPRPLPEATTES
jgi:hypothetical protein